MVRALIACMLSCLICACTGVRPQVIHHYDDWLGTAAVTVSEQEIFRSRDGRSLMTVRPVVAMGPDGRAYGVLTHLGRRSGTAPRIDRITSGAATLDYTPHDRLLTHCIDGCQRAEVGVIALSATAFFLAARDGLPLRVWDPRGRADGVVPAAAFRAVLQAVDGADP